MKTKIAILGSTGSIGKNLIEIVQKKKTFFKVDLLTAKTNYNTLIEQAEKLNVKNIILTDYNSFMLAKKKIKKKINIYNNFKSFNKIFKSKVDYSLCAISGLEGLLPLLNIIKYSKSIAIANKESIISGWNLISKDLKKFKTSFIPIDSEHFSIFFGIKDLNTNLIQKVYLTASGGPFLHLPLNKFKDISIKDALRHPNWIMGKKISIDSSTMMNKVFEVIEAKKIFNISYNKIKIIIHPKSYLHAIVKFKNGMIKLIAHDTTMKIPIANSLPAYNFTNEFSKDVDLEKLNNLKLNTPDLNKFPLIRIINNLPNNDTLFDTILVSLNDELVKMFLERKIKYRDISLLFLKLIKSKDLIKYKNISTYNISDITNLDKYVRIKVRSLVV